mgnify:CR=1 FL=1
MSGEADTRKELLELRDRITRWEVKLEEMNKRMEAFSKYTKDLYDYLRRQ